MFAKYSPDITRSQYRPFSEMLWRCRLHPKTFPVFGQRQLPASVARSHAVLALARGYSLIDRIAPDDTARLRVGV